MKHKIKILTEDCVLVENKIYFFSKDWNGLYVVNINSGKTELVGVMPEEEILAKRLCAGIVHYKGKLILIPMIARKIWIYDLEDNQWLGLKREYMTDEDCHKEIFRAIKYKNYLFMVGSNYPFILKMNLDTYELTYVSDPYQFVMPLKKDNEGYFRCDFCIRDNQLFVASCLNNFVLCLNLDTLDFEWMEVGESNFCYSGIAWDGENYWLSPRKATPIVKWDGRDKTEYFILPNIFDQTKYNFLGVQYLDGKVVFPGMIQKKTLVINLKNKDNIEVEEGQYLFYRCFEEGGVLLQTRDGLLRIKDPVQKQWKDLYCEIQLEDWIDLIKTGKCRYSENKMISKIWNEVSQLSLHTYLVLVSGEAEKRNKGSETGVNIWNAVRN